MTVDLRDAFAAKAKTNGGFAGVTPVGEAFQRAVDERLRAEVAARGIATLGLDAARSADWLDEVETAALCRLRPAQLELL